MTKIKVKLNTEEFGKQLKTMRLKSNYSQTEISEQMGIERCTLSRLENGKCKSHSVRLVIAAMQHYHLRHGLLTAEFNGVKYTIAIQEM